MTKKLLCTFAVGSNHASYLSLTRPYFEAFAARHDYDYSERFIESDRPPAWSKLLVLLDALDEYDEVLWIDSDVVIVNDAHDVADHVQPQMWQAMSLHTRFLGQELGTIPSTGFWFVRKPMIPFLEAAWTMTEYLHHPWWEQKAMHKLLGFASVGGDNAMFPVVKVEDTLLCQHTQFLEDTWHSLAIEDMQNEAYAIHVPALSHNRRLMTLLQWTKKADDVRALEGSGVT